MRSLFPRSSSTAAPRAMSASMRACLLPGPRKATMASVLPAWKFISKPNWLAQSCASAATRAKASTILDAG
eukprot:10258002-Lingulodinium_polyedra.AAC.1